MGGFISCEGESSDSGVFVICDFSNYKRLQRLGYLKIFDERNNKV